jgi:hypothetical protein
MSDAIAKSLNNLTVSLYMLERAVAESDAARRPPNKATPLSEIAAEICGDVEMCELEAVIHFMDRMAANARVRVRHLNKMTEAIKAEAT